MKKIFAILLLTCFIVILIITVNFNIYQKQQRQIQNFNRQYEEYNKEELTGVDITTLINKAISNNEKNNIAKDENGLYIENEENSIKVYITMIINGKTYPMESINKLGMKAFTSFFGEIKFKCTGITYHKKTAQVATMTFESIQY